MNYFDTNLSTLLKDLIRDRTWLLSTIEILTLSDFSFWFRARNKNLLFLRAEVATIIFLAWFRRKNEKVRYKKKKRKIVTGFEIERSSDYRLLSTREPVATREPRLKWFYLLKWHGVVAMASFSSGSTFLSLKTTSRRCLA